MVGAAAADNLLLRGYIQRSSLAGASERVGLGEGPRYQEVLTVGPHFLHMD